MDYRFLPLTGVSVAKNKVGSSLNRLFGTKAGTRPDFVYSAGMKTAGDSGLVWERSDVAWLSLQPKIEGKKGTKMAFGSLKDEQR